MLPFRHSKLAGLIGLAALGLTSVQANAAAPCRDAAGHFAKCPAAKARPAAAPSKVAAKPAAAPVRKPAAAVAHAAPARPGHPAAKPAPAKHT